MRPGDPRGRGIAYTTGKGSRRGLTLVELLASLALLGAVLALVGPWVRISLGDTRTIADHLRWEQAANAALQVVTDRVLQGSGVSPDPLESVVVEKAGLRFAGRSAEGDGIDVGRPAWIALEHDAGTSELLLRITPMGSPSARISRGAGPRGLVRLLVGEVGAIHVTRDREEKVLRLEIERDITGQRAMKEIRLR